MLAPTLFGYALAYGIVKGYSKKHHGGLLIGAGIILSCAASGLTTYVMRNFGVLNEDGYLLFVSYAILPIVFSWVIVSFFEFYLNTKEVRENEPS